jgi:ribonuclease D
VRAIARPVPSLYRFVKRPGEWRWSGHREYLGKEKSGLIELKDLLKSVATKAGLSAEILLRKGRLAKVVEARDRFIRQAVLAQGYLASQVANFLACHPSNVSRALQKN